MAGNTVRGINDNIEHSTCLYHVAVCLEELTDVAIIENLLVFYFAIDPPRRFWSCDCINGHVTKSVSYHQACLATTVDFVRLVIT
jgi:hypothetical protein